MLSFQVVETFLGGPQNILSGITDMEIVPAGGAFRLYTATRPGGGLLSLDVGASITLGDVEATAAVAAVPAPAKLTLATLGGLPTLLITGGSSGRLSGYRVEDTGALSAPVQVIGSPAGTISALVPVQVGGVTYFHTARLGESGIVTSELLANGRMAEVAQMALGADWQGVDISDLASVGVDGTSFVLALSVRQNALLSFRADPGGALVGAGSLGVAGGLGIAAPADIEIVRLAGVDYALVAGAGSSSISVVAVGAQGGLTLADHVIDSLDTRFQGVQALASVTLGDRVFVLAGGGDDGLNLFTLLPGGRLLLTGTVLQEPGRALDNITAISAVASGGQIETFVAGEGAGITRLRVDPGALAPMRLGGDGADRLVGDGRGDLLAGGAGNDTLDGAGGADILMDGAGADLLAGGAGADTFVLARDGATDTITDFEVGLDRLDLSAWGRIYAVEALEILTTGTGATIGFGAELLILHSADGSPIGRGVFTSADLFGLTHVLADPVVAGLRIGGTAGADTQTGGIGDDTLVGSAGADRMVGGAGFDFAEYSGATGGMRIDLMAPTLNTNLALGDVHLGIEGVIGGTGADNIRGTLGDDILRGGGNVDWLFGRRGNDQLEGGVGDDVLLGGVGMDTLSGGANRDRAQYSESLTGLTADLQSPQNNSGEAAGDVFEFIEDLAGSSHDDRLFGDAFANRLFGRDGADGLWGRNGADYLNGGAGRDTLDGGAANDTLRGGTHGDTFVFTGGIDVIEDFRRSEGDVLQIDDTIFGPGWEPVDLIDSFARMQGADVIFDFGFGNALTLQGVGTLSGFEDVLQIV